MLIKMEFQAKLQLSWRLDHPTPFFPDIYRYIYFSCFVPIMLFSCLISILPRCGEVRHFCVRICCLLGPLCPRRQRDHSKSAARHVTQFPLVAMLAPASELMELPLGGWHRGIPGQVSVPILKVSSYIIIFFRGWNSALSLGLEK